MAEELRPIETCPNGHRYNTWKYDDTCPVCGAKVIKEKDKMPEELEREKEQQIRNRVCGWLVCVKGPNQGVDYRLKEGKNFVGADPNMDVYIKGDKYIEKRNHAVIIHDSVSRKTVLVPGESKGMVYLKNQAVYEATDLENMSEIGMGKSVFYVVHFCSSKCTWEELIKKYKEENSQ